MQRFGLAALAFVIGTLVQFLPAIATDARLLTAGPIQVFELSGEPAHSAQRFERLAQTKTRDHRKRSPGSTVVAPPPAGKAITRDHRKRSPGSTVVAPPAAGKAITRDHRKRVQSNRVRWNSSDKAVLNNDGSVTVYRRVGGGRLGAGATYNCGCGPLGKGAGTCTETQGPTYILCKKEDFDTCVSTCGITTSKADVFTQ